MTSSPFSNRLRDSSGSNDSRTGCTEGALQRRICRAQLPLLTVLTLLTLGVLFNPAPATAQQSQPQYYTKQSTGITLEQAADTVRRRTGGRVLSATPTGKGSERGYNVRVLVDGKRVKQYYVDSHGRMSSR